MTSPVLTTVLCVVDGLGLMALAIAEGLVGAGRDDAHEQALTVASARPAQRDHVGSPVTVWELRYREHADALPYHPAPHRRQNRSDDDRAGAAGRMVGPGHVGMLGDASC